VTSRAPRSYPYAPDPGDLPLLRGEAWGGLLLTRLVVGAGLWLVLGSAAAAVLALTGLWMPWVAVPTLLVLGVVAGWVCGGLRSQPLPVWSAVALVVLSLAAALWAGATHSEQVLPRRDSGSYLQSSIDLASGHTRPVPIPAASVGGPDVLRIEGITVGSPAFYAAGTADHPTIQPQFPIGTSAWYSVAWWLGGASAAFWAPAVLFGLTVLSLGLLCCLLAGPRWGPLAALGTALLFPVLHVSRSTYSEPVALPVLAAGLIALTMAARGARLVDVAAARIAALVGGVLMGGAVLIRVDALREAVLVVPIAVLAMLQRQAHGRTLAAATAGSTVVAFALTGLTSWKYLGSIAGSLLPLVALAVAVCVAGAVLLAGARRGWTMPLLVQAWLPRSLVVLVLAGGALLATRPLWQTVHQSAADPGSHVVAALQAAQGLPVDGGRTYAEHSVQWMAWWVGPVALGIALVATAVLAHRAATWWIEGQELPSWTAAAVVSIGSTVLTLYRPGITPDHPWADRRLVIALPTVVLLVVASAAVLSRWSTRRLPYAAMVALSAASAASLLVPTALATMPHARERVEQGELTAVDQVCRQFRPGDVALMVDSRAANEWPQVLRGYCGVPALSTTFALRTDPQRLASAVGRIGRSIHARGGRLVLVAADSTAPLSQLGLTTAVVGVNTTVREDARLLEQRPDHLVDLPLRVWLGPTS
jgi:hypothetical protein